MNRTQVRRAARALAKQDGYVLLADQREELRTVLGVGSTNLVRLTRGGGVCGVGSLASYEARVRAVLAA